MMLGVFLWLCFIQPNMSTQTAGLSADGCDPPPPAPLTIVATGLTSGLGLETLKQLIVLEGVYRVLIGSRNIPPPEQTKQLLVLRSSSQTSIEYLPLDLCSPVSVDTFPKHVKDALRDTHIDVLLLCAGMSAGERRDIKLPVDNLKVEETLYVNVLGHVFIVNRLLSMMATTGRISIVNSGRHLNAPKRTCFDYCVLSRQ
jgi:NAD(P)-dependent dehydrogenase (short-subunit alcohol dehydrogenase family)